MTPQEHYTEAERLLVEGVKTVREISRCAAERAQFAKHDRGRKVWTRRMDEQGKKAMGIWAQAQVHATLANVEAHR